MIKSFLQKFKDTNIALNWLRNISPNDEIVFVSAATVVETKSIALVKWYQRFSQRQAILMLTKNKIVIKTNSVSPTTFFYSLMTIALFISFLISKDRSILLLATMPAPLLLDYPPYQRQIQYGDVRKLLLNPMSGLRTELVVDIKEKVIHTVLVQDLTPKALKLLTSHTKIVLSS